MHECSFITIDPFDETHLNYVRDKMRFSTEIVIKLEFIWRFLNLTFLFANIFVREKKNKLKSLYESMLMTVQWNPTAIDTSI